MSCVTLLSIGSIQSYLFRSNRLRENAGASECVRQALEYWRRPGLGCRVLFVAPDKAALEFENVGDARAAIFLWSRRGLDVAPGLRLAVAHEPFEGDTVEAAYQRAKRSLREQEDSAGFGADLGTLPVVRECQSTRLAAAHWDSGNRSWLSPEAFSKRQREADAMDRLVHDYGASLDSGYQFPREFENLGTAEGASQVAIVHADGNGIGGMFDDSSSGKVTALSEQVDALGQAAFRRTIKGVSRAIGVLVEREVVRLSWPEADEPDPHLPYFPLRPLVAAGDDLTFVCHGKLGLALAQQYLRNFETEATKPEFATLRQEYQRYIRSRGQFETDAAESNRSLTACAGVLVMPGKFPFARGYQLAAALTDSAKRRHRQYGGSWLDFQVILEAGAGDLAEIRARQYLDADGQSLTLRPYRVASGEPLYGGQVSWDMFEKLWSAFQDWPRSRAKGFLEVLRRGDRAARDLALSFRAAGVDLPARPAGGAYAEYWDALEMLDFHVAWPQEQTAHA
jgi:hypothetical protein